MVFPEGAISGEDFYLINEMKGKPLVSVIVPTYNRPDLLAVCLESINKQTYDHVEVILINDAGCDVGEIVKKANIKGNIKCIRHNVNKGLAASRNTGIRLATGKYIAYLDDDDRFLPEHVETLVTCLESIPAQVAYTDARRVFQEKYGDVYKTIRVDKPYSYDFDQERFLLTNYIPVLCMMHEKSCLNNIGIFDETLKVFEDWDLWIRMSRVYSFFHINKVTCEFTWRADGTSMTSAKLNEYYKTFKLLYKRYDDLSVGKSSLIKKQKILIIKRRILLFLFENIDYVGNLLGDRYVNVKKLKTYLF